MMLLGAAARTVLMSPCTTGFSVDQGTLVSIGSLKIS